jgi:biofilm PGA synthesis N-glycosyltransferase PgaC
VPITPVSPSSLARPQVHCLVRQPFGLPYVSVLGRFWITTAAGGSWALFSTWLALPWIEDLANVVGLPFAIAVIAGIAVVPGYLNVQLAASLLLDRQVRLREDFEFPPLAVLVAAFDEHAAIARTIAYVLDQSYPGDVEVIVVDDGSTDETINVVGSFARVDPRVQLIRAEHGGKACTLNAGLAAVTAPVLVTIDADTLLMPGALTRLVARLLLSPSDTTAVAGSVLLGNGRKSLVTAAQEWDYFLGISAVKRGQALLQGTLVAQGAFSAYETAALRRVGGWPDTIGEDIVLTWALLREGGRTGFEPSAVAFTHAPVTLRAFARQRRRWARGMIEWLRTHGWALVRQHRQRAHSVLGNFVFPYLDLTYSVAIPTGIVLACFGNFLIVGPMTVAVLPISGAIAGIMFVKQRAAFAEAGLKIRRNLPGFVAYFLFYQLIMSPTAVAGYLQEMLGARRRW